MLNDIFKEMEENAIEKGENASTVRHIKIYIDKKKQDQDRYSHSIAEIQTFIQNNPSHSQLERLFDILVIHEKPFDVAAYYIKHFIELDK